MLELACELGKPSGICDRVQVVTRVRRIIPASDRRGGHGDEIAHARHTGTQAHRHTPHTPRVRSDRGGGEQSMRSMRYRLVHCTPHLEQQQQLLRRLGRCSMLFVVERRGWYIMRQTAATNMHMRLLVLLPPAVLSRRPPEERYVYRI